MSHVRTFCMLLNCGALCCGKLCDLACPGSACDPNTCICCCEDMCTKCMCIPTSCGTESLISTVSKASSDASDVEVAVNKLVAAPFHTAVAYFLPSCCLLCFDPCYRTPEEARIVQNKILAQGVVKAAAEALSRTTSPDASKLHAPAFRLLEAYAPLDAAAAGRDGALAAAMASARAAGAAGRLVGNPALGLPCAAALAILIASPENAAAGDNNARLALAKEALELLKGEAELLAGFQAEESLLQVLTARAQESLGILRAVVAAGGAPVPLAWRIEKDSIYGVVGTNGTSGLVQLPPREFEAPRVTEDQWRHPPVRAGMVSTQAPQAQAMTAAAPAAPAPAPAAPGAAPEATQI